MAGNPYKSPMVSNYTAKYLTPSKSNFLFTPSTNDAPLKPDLTPSQYSLTYNNQLTSAYLVNGITNDEVANDLREIQDRYKTEAQEVQRSYQVNYEKHQKLINHIQELEAALENEKRRSAGLEESLNSSNRENEYLKRQRDELGRENNNLREELRRKDAQVNDMANRLHKAETDLSIIAQENYQLKADINRLKDIYNSKLREIEERYQLEIRELSGQNEAMRQRIEQLSGDYNEQMRQLNLQWDMKYKRVEDSDREKGNLIIQLENELRALTDHIAKLKNEFEDEMRRHTGAVREDEGNRWLVSVRELEAQIRDMKSERENLNRKIQELIGEIQKRDRELHGMKYEYDQELGRINVENVELKRQMDAIREGTRDTIEKLSIELNNKNKQIQFLDAEIASLKDEIEALRNSTGMEINRVIQRHNGDVEKWEELENGLNERIVELEEQVRDLREENRQVVGEYDRLKNLLAGNVTNTIAQTLKDHQISSSHKKGNNNYYY